MYIYILQWRLMNVTLSTIYVNTTIKRKRNQFNHFTTQNFIELWLSWLSAFKSCAPNLSSPEQVTTLPRGNDVGIVGFCTWCKANLNYWPIPSSADSSAALWCDPCLLYCVHFYSIQSVAFPNHIPTQYWLKPFGKGVVFCACLIIRIVA